MGDPQPSQTTVTAVAFDIGGVLEVPAETNLDGRWEQRLGLRPGEFFQRLRHSGRGRDANLGRVSEAQFAEELGRLYGLDQARIYALTCERLGARPGEVVFVDDTEVNVAAARQLGMRAVLFQSTAQAIAELEACLAGSGG